MALAPGGPQGLDDAVTASAAAVDGNPRWLVEDDEPPVLEAVVLANPALVDPHLAAAKDAVDAGPRQPFQARHEEIVDALAGVLLVDSELAGRGVAGGVAAVGTRLHPRDDTSLPAPTNIAILQCPRWGIQTSPRGRNRRPILANYRRPSSKSDGSPEEATGAAREQPPGV